MMRPVVTGDTVDMRPNHPVGQGRFWSNEALYLYTLLWDPFILARTACHPVTRGTGEAVAQPSETILFYAQPTPATEAQAIRQINDAGGRVVLTRPDPGLFTQFPEMAPGGVSQLVSLRERWDLGQLAKRSYYYRDREPFHLLDDKAATALSWIGDNPDLVCADNVAIFAGNPLAAMLCYLTVPYFPRLLLDFSGLLIELVAELSQTPVADDQAAAISAAEETRRDFHAFGFAFLTVLELERCYGSHQVDLHQTAGFALAAARELVAGSEPKASELLAAAFAELERQNRILQPTPAVFTDTLHGGGLFDDLGYFEFDWPQHTADQLRMYLDWATRRSYRFNVDFAAASIKGMAARFPRLFAELKAACHRPP